MNKKIFSLALAAIMVLGASFSAMAAKPKKQKKDSCPANTECVAAQCNTPQECGCPEGKGQRPDPFAGLNLTADQQAKLEALKQEVRKDRQEATQRMRQAADSIRQEGKRAKREGRSEAVEAGQQIKRGSQVAGERSRQWLGKVKEILTPEQYVQYLENSFVQQSGRHDKKKGPDMRRREGRGHGHNGQGAPAPQRERK